MMVVLPYDVRQSNEKRDHGGDPEPFCGQQPPIQTYQQSQYECAEEEHCRVLVFEPKPEQHAAPQQNLWLSAVHCEQHEINAAHPKQWLDWVHGKTSRVAKDHRSRLQEAIVLDTGPEFR